MKKQEKIKEAYGEYKGRIDDNGWTNFMAIEYFGSNNLDSKIHKGEVLIYRPKSLKGIENNNGWIRIESEKDFPKDDCICYFVLKSNKAMLTGYFRNGCFDYSLRYYDENEVTHYQPIQKPEPPIY